MLPPLTNLIRKVIVKTRKVLYMYSRWPHSIARWSHSGVPWRTVSPALPAGMGPPHSPLGTAPNELWWVRFSINILEVYTSSTIDYRPGPIDGFHSIFSLGNWRALHHHAPCWLVNIHITCHFYPPVSMVKDAMESIYTHCDSLLQHNAKTMECSTVISRKRDVTTGLILNLVTGK